MITLTRLRLRLKRAFVRYYTDLCSHRIADPAPAYDAAFDYLAVRLDDLGPELFKMELQDEGGKLAGEIEQDLRLGRGSCTALLEQESLEGRLWECLDTAVKRLSI